MTSEVISVSSQATMAEAIRLADASSVRHLVVKNHHGALVGIVSDRDWLALPPGRKSEPVKSHMTGVVYTVGYDDSPSVAGMLMLDQQVNALPVIGEANEVIGIVTTADYVRYACQRIKQQASSSHVGRLDEGHPSVGQEGVRQFLQKEKS